MIRERRNQGAERVMNAKRTQLCCSSQVPQKDIRTGSSGGKIVAMMQTAYSGHGNDPSIFTGIRSRRPSSGGSFAQSQMRSIFMVVMDVISHQAFQMTLIENNDMIEQVPAAVTDPAFGNAVLPRTSKAGSLGLNAQGFDHVDHLTVEVRRPIKDQIFRGRIVRECFSQSLYNLGTI